MPYPCKCCGNNTLPVPSEDAIAYICPICWWENDVFTQNDDEPSHENRGISLNQARQNYKECGFFSPDFTPPEWLKQKLEELEIQEAPMTPADDPEDWIYRITYNPIDKVPNGEEVIVYVHEKHNLVQP